jgi:hypothetical protein
MTSEHRDKLIAEVHDAVRSLARGNPDPLAEVLVEILQAMPTTQEIPRAADMSGPYVNPID